MPLLRGPNDHHRDIRRRAPCTVFIAEPDQDRHLMIDVALLPAAQRRSPSPPVARRSRKAASSQRPRALSKRRARAGHHMRATGQARRLRSHRQHCRPPAHAPTRAICPRPPNLHRSRPTKQRPSSLRFPPWEAFERRPHLSHDRPARGRRPKPFTEAGIDRRPSGTSRQAYCSRYAPPSGRCVLACKAQLHS